MKEINRAFAMRVLEKQSGKTEQQMLKESESESDQWPMGRYEFENSVGAIQKLARTVIDYFGDRQSIDITRNDIEEIYRRNMGLKELTPMFKPNDSEIESRRKLIKLILSLYNE